MLFHQHGILFFWKSPRTPRKENTDSKIISGIDTPDINICPVEVDFTIFSNFTNFF
jgi:hypothetical protein